MRQGFSIVLGLVATGCIFAEPPERTPQRTPVFLDVADAVPKVTRLLTFGQQDPQVDFLIPIRSEDAGERVFWAAYENLGLSTGRPLRKADGGFQEPSTITDTSRTISFTYRPSLTSAECFQLTVIACHESSWEFQGTENFCRSDAHEDTGTATWWINYGDPDDPASFANCPQ